MAVRLVLADGMLLTVRYVVGPVAGVKDIVIQQGEGALLDCCCTVPALPVSGTAGLVGEHSVQPWAVVGTDGGLSHDGPIFARTSHPVGVVAVRDKSFSFSREGQSVGAGPLSGNPVFALVVVITVLVVRYQHVVFLALDTVAALGIG